MTSAEEFKFNRTPSARFHLAMHICQTKVLRRAPEKKKQDPDPT